MEASGQITPDQVEQAIEEAAVKSWKWLMFFGILAILAGFVAIIVPAVASVGIAILIGWLFVIFGIFQMGAAFTIKGGWHMVGRFLLGLITAAAGVILLVAPLEGTVTLTFVLAIFYLASGAVSIGTAIGQRGTGQAGFLAINGILALIIGLLVIVDFPSSAAWALGLLAGIYLIFEGITLIGVAGGGRRLKQA